ncbi:MAG: aminotransferase class I/II-fold pyridoxal phosphate-dependent enzyme, partial [Pseudomonadota bacterium]|nr:aminotransferase class I/II-fold pyridoxal phosphate-dependent enzyme [Pseudomonadota bacterium]
PSGYVPEAQQWQELGDYLRQKDWWIFSDEIYEYFNFFNDRKHLSPLNINPDLRQQTVIFNGMSKGFGMTGWRVGYALGAKQIISQIKKLQSQSTTCLPSFVEEAAAAALRGGYELVRAQINAIEAKCVMALKTLADVAEISFIQPAGAFFVFIRLPAWLQKSETPTALLFSKWLLHNYKVVVVPGEGFGVDNHIRVSCGANADDLAVGLELLATSLKKLKHD